MYAISKQFREKKIRFFRQYITAILLMGLPASLLSQNLNNPNKQGPLGTQVNTFTGNLYIPRTDVKITARMFDLNVKFYYNSFLFQEDYGYGKGWSFEYNIHYKKHDTLAGAKIIFWGDGREDQYGSIPGGGYYPADGFYDTLSEYEPAKYMLTQVNGVKYFFDDPLHKHITKLQEPNGNFIQFLYTDSLLTGISNNAGQSANFKYNAQGRLATVTDEVSSAVFTYTYDINGNLLEVKDPMNGRRRYTYLTNGPMKTIADKNSNKVDIIYFPDLTLRELVGCNKRMSFSYDTSSNTTIITDHLENGNQITKYTYQRSGNVFWISSVSGNCCGFNIEYQYDANGNMLKEKDANGKEYFFTYDDQGNVITATDPLGNVNSYTYTAAFRKMKSHTDPKGNVSTFDYDSKGNLIRLVTPGNNVYTATYNSYGDLISSKDAAGNIYLYTYDAFGNPSTVSGPNGYNATLAYDAQGNLLSYTDARGNSTSLEFDILRRLKKITDPLNKNVQLSYDLEGNLVNLKNKNNETSILNYDASNRLINFRDPKGNNSSFSYDEMDNLRSYKNPMDHQFSFNYDNRNRLSGTTNADGTKNIYNHDGNGNITSMSLPNGRTLHYSYDAVNRVTTVKDATGNIAAYNYDKNSNVISYTNAAGAVYTAQYDSLNRKTKITDPLGNHVSFTYDKSDNIKTISDRESHTTSYTYDSLNRVKTITDNNGFTTNAQYDATGNLASLTDQKNNTTTYIYDKLNRRTRMTFPGGTYQEYTYDAKNNIKTVRQTDGGIITYQHDTLNRIMSRSLPDGQIFSYTYDKLSRVLTATNNSGTVSFTYDAMSRVTSESFNGTIIRYGYNVPGRTFTTIYPDSTVVVKEMDSRNRLIKVSMNNEVLAEYTYNNSNKLTERKFANGVNSLMQYDFDNKLNSLNSSNQQSGLQNSIYTYDKQNNKIAISRPNNPALSEQYVYDNGYRLTQHKKGIPGNPAVQNSYTYDPAGNRTQAVINGNTNNYGSNNLNQLTTLNGNSLSFDARGNLTFDGTRFKKYDAENRLIKDSLSPSNVITYGYDALNRRVLKNINGNILKYTYSGASAIEERSGTGILINKTVFNSFLSPVVNEKNNQRFYYHPDEMGSVEAISTGIGRLLETYRYDAYGKTSRYDSLGNPLASSLAGNRFGFTGQEYDSTSGSYLFFFRNYLPETGRFLQRDLIEYADGMGMYLYVGNNPANGVDTWGLQEQPVCLKDQAQTTNDYLTNGLFSWETGAKIAEAFETGMVDMAPASPKSIGGGGTVLGAVDLTIKTANNFDVQTNGTSTYNERVDANYDVVGSGGGLLAGLGAAAVGGPVGLAVGIGTGVVAATDFVSTQATGKSLRQHTEAPIVGKFQKNAESEAFWDWADKEGLTKEIFAKQEDYYFLRNIWEQNKHITYMQWRKSRNLYITIPNLCGGGTRVRVRWVWDPVKKMWVLRPIDPNLIVGPDGEPGKAWVPLEKRMPYTVLFENDSTATAPAKIVRITTAIHPKHDLTTFELGSVGFNNQSFDIPAGTASYYTRLDCRDSLNLFVDLTAGYDQVAHQAFWEFQSIDPLTLLPTEQPLAGFVRLRDSLNPMYGHGFVNYSIKPIAAAHTLDTVTAQASIVFDQNEAIATNVHGNTIDAVAPSSSISGLIPFTPDTEVPLHYTGFDDTNGSGLKYYSIYVSDNGATPQLFVENFTKADTVFRGTANHSYRFYAVAKDTAGNIETMKALDSIRITNGEFVICPDGNVSFDSKMNGASFQWQVNNGTGYTNIINGGIYSGATTAVLTLTAAPSSMYGFRYRCVANSSNSLEFILKFGMNWDGTVSEAWENPANWSCGALPDANTDVTIDAAKNFFPKVNSNVTIRSIRLNNGTTGTVSTGFNLTILK